MKRLYAAAAVLLLAAGGWWYASHGDGMAGAGVVIGGGDGGGLPRSTPVDEHVSGAGLTAAQALAQQHGLAALLVARHGHLLLDYYSAPEQQTRLLAGGAMSEALLAQLGDAPPASAAVSAAAVQGDALSRQIWQPLNAGNARLIEGQVHARAADWLRFGLLLLGGGQFEGANISTAARIAAVRYEATVPTGEALASHDVHALRAPGGTILWLLPSLQLVVLQVGGDLSDADTLLVNPLIRAIEDRGDSAAEHSLLNRLVPGH